MGSIYYYFFPTERPSHVVIELSPAPNSKHPQALPHSFMLSEVGEGIPIRQHTSALEPMMQEGDSQLTNVSSVDTFWIPSRNIKPYHADIFWGEDYNVYIRAVAPLIINNKIRRGLVEANTAIQLTEKTTIYFCETSTEDPLLVWSVEKIRHGRTEARWMEICHKALMLISLISLLMEFWLQFQKVLDIMDVNPELSALGALKVWAKTF